MSGRNPVDDRELGCMVVGMGLMVIGATVAAWATYAAIVELFRSLPQ